MILGGVGKFDVKDACHGCASLVGGHRKSIAKM